VDKFLGKHKEERKKLPFEPSPHACGLIGDKALCLNLEKEKGRMCC
jgi:hypothetical protein